MWQVRDTGALLSPSHGTGEYQPRGEHDCSGGTLLGETIIVGCVSPALLRPPRNTNNHEDFRFWTCFSSSAHTTKAQTKLRKPQYLRTARTADQPSIGPAQSSKARTSSSRPRQRKQAGTEEQVKCCPEPWTFIYVYFFPHSLFFHLCLYVSQPPTINLDFSKYR